MKLLFLFNSENSVIHKYLYNKLLISTWKSQNLQVLFSRIWTLFYHYNLHLLEKFDRRLWSSSLENAHEQKTCSFKNAHIQKTCCLLNLIQHSIDDALLSLLHNWFTKCYTHSMCITQTRDFPKLLICVMSIDCLCVLSGLY